MAEALGAAAVGILGRRLLVGRDTRASGLELQNGLVAGITSAGGQALLADIVPTPAVAFLVCDYEADGGVVISASHNPAEYNGIKFFNARGYKLTDAQEDRFEEALQAMPALDQSVINAVDRLDQTTLADADERYITHAVHTLTSQNIDLAGIKVVVDCAHGAAFYTTPEALRRLNAEVIVINGDFNGSDINDDCGSTHIDQLIAAVLAHRADIGIAHDGDADRMLAVDASGHEIDGDFIKAICAADLKSRGRLANDTVVSTKMANQGFIEAMEALQITVIRTEVGDSKVLSAMLEGGYNLGGEQSGHIIFHDYTTTGDGLISALQLLAVMQRTHRPLHQLAQIMQVKPQVLRNVKVANLEKVVESERLAVELVAVGSELGSSGYIYTRASGTEPVYRIMVQASSLEVAESYALKIEKLVLGIGDAQTGI